MDERLLTRLREAGMEGEVSAQLLHGDAAFALSADHLGYVDAAGARTVALKDINRIHSDREGLLRVETQDSTAITASLLGFDPAGVQAFFNQVRNNTNQAKSLPQTAIPQPSANPWKSGWSSGQPRPTGGAETDATPATAPADLPARSPDTPLPATAPASGPTQPQPAPTSPAPRPVVISTTPRFNPDNTLTAASTPPQASAPKQAPASKSPATKPAAPTASVTTANPPAATVPAAVGTPAGSDPAGDKAQEARVKLVQREQAGARVSEQRSNARPSNPATPRPVPTETVVRTDSLPRAPLQALADSVAGLISTLRLLAVAMGLAAILVGVLRFRENDPVTGLWIIGSGLVAAFALLVFAQVARLLVGIARRLQQDA